MDILRSDCQLWNADSAYSEHAWVKKVRKYTKTRKLHGIYSSAHKQCFHFETNLYEI